MIDVVCLNEGDSVMAAPILDDCIELLRDFGNVTIELCNSESNAVAHQLAGWGMQPIRLCGWTQFPILLLNFSI